MKYFILLILSLLSIAVNAQSCDCSNNFDFMVKKVKANYVGYSDKVTKKNKVQFQKFTDSLKTLTLKSSSADCAEVCRKWLDFFKDQHLGFSIEFGEQSADLIRSFFAKEEKTSWTENNLNSHLQNKKSKIDNVEGIWENSSGTYQIGIVKDSAKENEFIGFIIKADGVKWVPQQIKWRLSKSNNEYKTLYYRAIDHSLNYPRLIKGNDTLDFGLFGKWHKGVSENRENIKSKSIDVTPKFKILDNETCLFEMPSFGSLEYISVVDSLTKKNESILKRSKHLIIDLRNNSGGTVLVFKSLMPYIYTKPILTEGASVLATEDNIKDRYSAEYPELADSIRRTFKQNLLKLKAHVGELYNLYPIDTIKYETILKSPERISFLVNKNTASAAELFLLQAKQSSKVKLYGENTAGAIDYLEVVNTKMPCSFYSLWYPAAKSNRLPSFPLDNIGIEPDVKISDKVDWIDFVKNH